MVDARPTQACVQAVVQHSGMVWQTVVTHASAPQSVCASMMQAASQGGGSPAQQLGMEAQTSSTHGSKHAVGSRAGPSKQTEWGQVGSGGQTPQSCGQVSHPSPAQTP